ncbi:TOM1-like protein 2 isoform X2 [Patella vulgata]|uniref:TOM1-like protein 2 isoform X2 n=1 Tax=Patella vulgata TaxID=6465 RepID=UPI00217FCB5C|nr:TOM1-like protein 2 isoform X2 [Patella vulgata]
MAALFGHGNPFATQVGQMIEKSTDGSQASENWGLFMEICDLINETDEGPKDAIKAIRKRLTQNVGKNYTAVMYTLTCLETCVKNCEKRFHLQVAHKDFLHELIKIIGPKNDPPQVVQEKILSLIQTWADAFRGQPDLKEVDKVYQELKSKGIEFPMTDLDHMAPIHTPARSVPDSELPISRTRGSSNRAPAPQGTMPAPVTQSGPPSQDQSTKLQREMEVVKGNVRVMSEMLTELTPTSVDPSDLELLQELNRTCRNMQQRLVELITNIGNEEVTNELLRVNDDLNNVFLRYERFERYRTGNAVPDGSTPEDSTYSSPPAQENYLPPSYDQVVSSPAKQPSVSANPPAIQASSNNEGNLIDLGESPKPLTAAEVQTKLGALRVGSNPPTYDNGNFDMFAQSRQSFEENKQSKGGSGYNQQDDQFSGTLAQSVNAKAQPEVLNLQDKETDYDEMEAYIRETQPGYSATGETISSSEFDRFLNERAATATNVPSIPAETGQTPQRGGTRNSRQIQKDDDDNPLFAL